MGEKPKTTGRDYGHRLYMNTTAYPAAIRRPSDKQYDNRQKRPHSDDKKPYMEDEYPEMEHYWTPYDPPTLVPPGVPDDPRIPPNIPDMPGGPPFGEFDPGVSDFTGCIFTVPRGPIVLKRGETSYHGIGLIDAFEGEPLPDPLVQLYVNYGPITLKTTAATVNGCQVGPYPTCTVIVQAKDDFDPADHYEVADDTYACQVVGVTKSGGTCAWDLLVTYCPPTVDFEWDYENSAETIASQSQAVVFVLGGAPPFTWVVTGDDGFSLEYNETDGRTNILYAAAGSCGSAIITVIDGCDNEVEASLRNVTSGEWTTFPDTCGLAAEDNSWARTGLALGNFWTLTADVTIGGERQVSAHRLDYGGAYGGGYYETEGECDAQRFIDCGVLNASCAPLPNSVRWTSGSYAGTYYYCGAGTRKYARLCSKPSTLWTFGYSLLRPDPNSLTYYTWDCPE